MSPCTIYFIVPRLSRTGGYERQALDLAQALRERGTLLKVLTDCEMNPPSQDCHTIPTRSLYGTYGSFHREFATARTRGPTVVHLHALYRFSAAGLWAAQRLRLPTILKLPSSTDVQSLFCSSRPTVRLFQSRLQRVNRFICPSRDIVAELRPHLRNPGAAVYLPNGVDTHRFTPDTAAKLRRAEIRFRKVILHVGRHVALKGGDILLKAFARAQRSLPPDTGLVFLGGGEQTDVWKQLAVELGVAQAVLFADIHTEPERYYRAADAFVLPSLREGMPNSLLEAMACGLPCLASDTGGIRDILADRFPGQLVPPGDVNALAAGLVGLLQPGVAPLGEQLRVHVEAHFSMDVISQRLMKVYEELLQSPID